MPSCAGRRAARCGLDILYTNTEGEAVTAIYKADRARVDGILFNPAGFLHAGHALRDCLRSIRAPAIEIHMTNIEKRGYGSVTSEAAVGMIAGFGIDSYVLALEAMVARLRRPEPSPGAGRQGRRRVVAEASRRRERRRGGARRARSSTRHSRSAPAGPLPSGCQSIVAVPWSCRMSPDAKSMNIRPARGSPKRLPSVL